VKKGEGMNQEIIYNYDKEVDVLYISFAPGEKATTAVELNDHILLRFNRAEKRAVGLTLMDFSILVQLVMMNGAMLRAPRGFPLTGLRDLEPDWQETVLEIITQPPVNQILRVAVYTPSITEAVPIALVNNPLTAQYASV
jgi:uncharacterized protein YuzE